MKRLTLLTILLVVVGLTAGFALELKPSFELTGSGTVSWGIDLNTMRTGFKNEAEADLTVTLLAEDGSDAHQGEGDWYGWIEISDVELFWTDDEAASGAWNADGLGVEAKIMGLGGKLAIGVYDAPDLSDYTDFVNSIEDDEDGDYKTLDDETSDAYDVATAFSTYGTYISYAVSENLTVGLEAVSYDTWEGETLNQDVYALALDVMATFAPLTVKFGANYGLYGYDTYPTFLGFASPPLGFGVNVAADTDMVDGWVGFDGQLVGSAFSYEFGLGATATLMEGVTAALAATYNVNTTGAPMAYADQDIDVEFIFTEPGDAGLMDALDLSVTVWLLDLMGRVEYEVIVDGGYTMGDWYPNFKVDFGEDWNLGLEPTWDDPVSVWAGTYFNVTLGVDFTGIPLTTLGIYWQDTDFSVYGGGDADIGNIVFSAKVSY